MKSDPFLPNGVTIIGYGNLGKHLAEVFQSKGVSIRQIYSSKKQSNLFGAELISSFELINDSADIYFLTVPDDQIEEISQTEKLKGKFIVHCSGSTPLSALPPLRRGVFYPLQSFTEGVKVNWKEIPILIEASSPEDLDLLSTAGELLSDRVTQIDSDKRLHLHLAAVIASNFTTHCITLSEQILNEQNLDKEILKPLIRNSIEKALSLGGRAAQTGPAIRQDKKVMDKHLKLLEENLLLKKIYTLVSESIIKSK